MQMPKTYYIGYSKDEGIRYSSASGGVGTTIIKYLLESREFGTSMTFVFNSKECKYEPRLIHNFSEYNNCGSIYQDTDTIGFIKQNKSKIKNGIVVTCMPCQVRPIRSILSRNNINHFIISLCCSGQTTTQGTWFYYKLLGIRKGDVANLQYRGKGWPSGIQIRLKNGELIKRDNYTFPWTTMHESLLFRPRRCLSCNIKTSKEADVSLADPWLKDYIGKDKIGNTLVICNTYGREVIFEMLHNNLLKLKEVDETTYLKSQLGTVELKYKANQYKIFNNIVYNMNREGSFYKRVVTSSVFLLHCHIKLIKVLRRILK